MFPRWPSISVAAVINAPAGVRWTDLWTWLYRELSIGYAPNLS